MRKEFFENLKAERTTYKDMIDFCCDNLVMNNSIMQELTAKGFYRGSISRLAFTRITGKF